MLSLWLNYSENISHTTCMWWIFRNFTAEMKLDLYINEANDYARDIGAPVLHPHVAIIHYDETGEIRHSLNRINCYGIFLQREFPENLTYGIGTYKTAIEREQSGTRSDSAEREQNRTKFKEGDGSLMAYSPGQIGGKLDDGTRRQYHGWVLLFDAAFIHGTEIEQRLSDYHFFSYDSNEALFLKPQEKETLAGLMANIRAELQSGVANPLQQRDDIQDDIVRDYIQLILDYCKRFYARQFKEMSARGSDILARFQQVLIDYYAKARQRTDGLPSVKYCASELCLSPGYFGDIVRSAMGESPKEYIRSFVIHRAKNQILSGQSIAQVADDLGLEYSQHFTRMFKQQTGQTPSEYLAEQRKK